VETISEHRCRYCEKTFQRESTLAVHLCEAKRRHQQQNEKGVQLGLQAYLRFYETTQGSAKYKTYDDFSKSPYYNAFVKWGRHCVNINAINVSAYIEWLLKNNKKLDHWHRDSMYDEYLQQYLRTEALSDALQRAIEYSIRWGEERDLPPQDFLRYGNYNTVAFAISTGRISPWVVYNCASGQQFLENMNTDQMHIVWPWIETDFWQRKFRDYPADQAYAEEILKQAGW